MLMDDMRVIQDRDPAAKSMWETLLYPGLHAVLWHRVAHRYYRRRKYLLARLISQVARFFTGIEIHPGARLGRGLFIDHGMGVVIGETAAIGENVTLFQGVTLGGTGTETGKRHPTVGNNVMIAANATLLGAIRVGDNSKIGAGSVVIRDVPPEATVVGVPGRVVRLRGKRVEGVRLDHGNLPDPVRRDLATIRRRLTVLEKEGRVVEHESPAVEDEAGNVKTSQRAHRSEKGEQIDVHRLS